MLLRWRQWKGVMVVAVASRNQEWNKMMRLNHSGRRSTGMIVKGLAVLMCLGWSVTAQAQDEMTFGVEEVEEVKEAAPVGKFLAEGEKYYDKKEYRQASIMFYKAKVETDASAD